MTSFSWATRQLALVCALATAAIATYVAVDAELEHRKAATDARVAREYAGIAYLVGRQRQLVVDSRGGRSNERREADRLTRDIQLLLARLRARAEGAAAEEAAALGDRYAAASRASAIALRSASPALHRENVREAAAALEAVEAQAIDPLRETSSELVRGATGLTAALALILAASLARLRLYRRRDGDRADVEVARLRAAAMTDNLTGLGNHRSFHHDLLSEVRRRARTGSPFTLMAIDLDGLKQINDTQGHQAGDKYIRQISDCVRRATGEDGIVYRTGGDEFMVLLPGRRNWHGFALAQRVAELTRAASGRRAVSIGVTESIGTETQHLLIHEADVALYEAKRSKLTAVIYHPGLTSSAKTGEETPSHHQKALAAALARAVDAKAVGTRSHSETVSELCVAIGTYLGFDGDGVERLRLAGLLHDVGKIGVPDAILHKPAALAPDEEDQMREHVRVGHGILLSAELPVEAEWVLHHHERYDGTGYPAGLRADEIPLESRIIAVADAFEAMTGTRPYRDQLRHGEALAELACGAGTQFDEDCVSALAAVIDVTADPDSSSIVAA
ncbi:MAG: diguanylate cyclase [Actinobacteria bacterium]|nr:diguanylate cyclase [Actinomycetota bacterium]